MGYVILNLKYFSQETCPDKFLLLMYCFPTIVKKVGPLLPGPVVQIATPTQIPGMYVQMNIMAKCAGCGVSSPGINV